MATVYKVEVEIVSDWINYTPEEIEEIIKKRIEETHPLLREDLEVTEINVKRKA